MKGELNEFAIYVPSPFGNAGYLLIQSLYLYINLNLLYPTLHPSKHNNSRPNNHMSKSPSITRSHDTVPYEEDITEPNEEDKTD